MKRRRAPICPRAPALVPGLVLSSAVAVGQGCGPDEVSLGELPSECGDEALSIGSACFEAEARVFSFDLEPLVLLSEDFDADGYGDLLVGGTREGAVVLQLWPGSAEGPVGPGVDPGVASCTAYPVVGRIGTDVPGDVVTATCGPAVDLWRGSANGFVGPTTMPLPGPVRSSDIVDLDADGIRDLLVLVSISDNEAALSRTLSRADESFTAATGELIVGLPFVAKSMTTADLDHDGRTDAILRDAAIPDGLASALARPAGFAAPRAIASGGLPQLLAVADVDGDGNHDLMVGDREAARLASLHGDGAGAFGPPVPMALPHAGATHLATADFEGDGAAEVLVADPAVASLAVVQWADTSLTQLPPLPMPAGCDMVVITDLDGDGVLDLLAGHFASASFSVRRGLP